MTPPPAMADDIFGPDDDPATDEPPQSAIEPDPLIAFVDRFTVPHPDQRLDAADLLKAYLGWCLHHPSHSHPPSNAAAYSRLRLQGHNVVRGAGNRQWIAGRTLAPHVLPEYQRFMGLADDPAARQALTVPTEVTVLGADLRREAARYGREALAPLYAKAVAVLRETMEDPDPRVRQISAKAVLNKFVPDVKGREPEDDVIDVPATISKPALVEVEALIRAKLAQGG
jgi:hypothetical protein